MHKHLLYIPSLAFLYYYAPINVDVFVEYGMWELGIFRLIAGCHDGSEYILLHYFCTPQKASVGMYSRCLCLTNLVCVLFDPAIPTLSFNFIVFYTCYIPITEVLILENHIMASA